MEDLNEKLRTGEKRRQRKEISFRRGKNKKKKKKKNKKKKKKLTNQPKFLIYDIGGNNRTKSVMSKQNISLAKKETGG